MPDQNKPKCPQCGRRKAVQPVGEFFKCTACGALFDTSPDEGGDYHTDPTRRLAQQEGRRRG